MKNIIEMNHIAKFFPPNVMALDDVSVDFRKGEIHSIVGENGAGKSTLVKILYSLEKANSGKIYFNDVLVNFRNTSDAIDSGIGMVHQEVILIPELKVWENVILGIEPTNWFGHIDTKKARVKVAEKISSFQFNLVSDTQVADLSVAARQKVEILKLLYRNVSILILDEPTSVLTPQEIPQLFNELKSLRDSGNTIIFISHHLDEVLDLSDRITVLRKGKKIGTVNAGETDKKQLAQMMVGREVFFVQIKEPQEHGKDRLVITNLNYYDNFNKHRLKDVNISVRDGEIVGIAGVEGNGQLELVNTIMGLIKPNSGSIFVSGQNLVDASILERRKNIAYVSQDRKNMSASVNSSILENSIMTHHRLNPSLTRLRGSLINIKNSSDFTDTIHQNFDVQMSSANAPFRSLSGGNQQKVILGRELLLDAPFLLLDQPTRGLDVGSIEYVHQRILEMRSKYRAILLLSAELDELFRLSDRILVFNQGRVVANLETDKTNIEEVGYLMLEGAPDET